MDACLSACDEHRLSCTATLAGTRIELHTLLESEDIPGVDECPDVCENAAGSCQVDIPAPGTYQFGFASRFAWWIGYSISTLFLGLALLALAPGLDRAIHDAGRSQTRVSALEARVDALREQDLALGEDIATREPTTPEAADLAGVAEQLEDVIGAGDPKQAKALLRLLIKDLRVNGRREILPTYRVVAPEVCALPSSVGAPGIEPGTSRV